MVDINRKIADSFIKTVFRKLEKFATKLTKQAYAGKLTKAGRKALKI